ncbi:HEAT repeat domain containing protein [Entamoeba marina]
MSNTDAEFDEFLQDVSSSTSKRKAAYKRLPEMMAMLSFQQMITLVPIFHHALGSPNDPHVVALVSNILPLIRRLYSTDNDDYRTQAMLLVAPLTEMLVNAPKSSKKAAVKCLKKVVPVLLERDFRGYVYSISKALLLDDSDPQNQVLGIVLVTSMLPRIDQKEKISLLLPKLPDLLMSKNLPLRKQTIKMYTALATQLPIDYVNGMIVPAIVCGANDKDFIVRKKTSESIISIASIATEGKSNLIRPFFSLVQDANKPNAIATLRLLPSFLSLIESNLANQYADTILTVLLQLAKDTVRLFPDAPTAVGKSLVSIINYFLNTHHDDVLTIVTTLAESNAIGARYSVGVCFQLFVPFIRAEKTRGQFLAMFDSLLKDQKVVQLAAIGALADVIGIVNQEQKQRYLTSFMSFMDDPFWRVRLQIASFSVGESVDVLGHCFKLLNDPMAATRSTAAKITAQVYLQASPSFREKVKNNFIVLSKRNYHRRKVILEFVVWVFAGTTKYEESIAILEKFYLTYLSLCADDPIPNVRLHLCHSIRLISTKYPQYLDESTTHDTICQLMADDDTDVEHIANEYFRSHVLKKSNL